MADNHDPAERDEPSNDPGSESAGGDRYIPTPEEIESGDAPTVPVRSQPEEVGEGAAGFFERFRMRRRKGVGGKRKYVTPETQTDAGGGEDDEPPDSSGVFAALGDEPPDRDEGGAEEELPAADSSRDDVVAEEDGPGVHEQTVEAGKGSHEDERDHPEDEDSGPDQPPPPVQRVGSVSIGRRRDKKPEPEPERRLSPEESCIARLFRVAEEHGHTMGDLKPDLASDNSTAQCINCALPATLVRSREDMSTYVRCDIRGPALERRCKP